eukprot:6298519-Amphidinium_carterae.1
MELKLDFLRKEWPRASARRALGKGAGLRRSAPVELIAHGVLAADPQVPADLSTVRVWHRRILAGKVEWPLEARLPIALDGCQTLAARGFLGTKLLFVLSGTLLRSCAPKWLALERTLRA